MPATAANVWLVARHPFKVEIMGSKPIRGTIFRHKPRPLVDSRGLVYCVLLTDC